MITLTLFCLLLKAAGFVLKLLWLAFGVVAYGAEVIYVRFLEALDAGEEGAVL